MTFLSPLRGCVSLDILPTACAVGCILAPLRGYEAANLAELPAAIWQMFPG
jgi:hypothetical protein